LHRAAAFSNAERCVGLIVVTKQSVTAYPTPPPPSQPVAEKTTELLPGPNPGPVTVAESAFGFAMLPRTQLPRRAMPLPSVVVTGDVSAPSPPVTTNVTLSPAIGSPSPSRTSTDGTVGTAAPAIAAWLVPALMMILGAIRVSVTDTVREAT